MLDTWQDVVTFLCHDIFSFLKRTSDQSRQAYHFSEGKKKKVKRSVLFATSTREYCIVLAMAIVEEPITSRLDRLDHMVSHVLQKTFWQRVDL